MAEIGIIWDCTKTKTPIKGTSWDHTISLTVNGTIEQSTVKISERNEEQIER